MTYLPEFKGWTELTLSDLLVAYRKAKADCYYQNVFPVAIKFAEYEQDLLNNLTSLLERLKNNEGFADDKSLIGEFRLIPKKLNIKPRPEHKEKGSGHSGHVHFSNPDRAFAILSNDKQLVPEFRIIGDFSVDMHIISALWINMIGHKFDACLDECCYGARLRRFNGESDIETDKKPFHITSYTSFVPYYKPYKQWRGNGLNTIRSEIKQDRKIIAVSLDLRSYYHFIDPSFLKNESFLREIGLKDGNALNKAEINFTEELSRFLKKWANKASKFSKNLNNNQAEIKGGLVIGLTATRIISNVLLHKWDRLVTQKVTPIYYGRYVDDMFLVMHDPGNINNSNEFMNFLRNRLDGNILKKDGDDMWDISLGRAYQARSKIQLQAGKQKLFILEGQSGLDLLDSIEKEIIDLSSERRLMPSPNHIENSTAMRVLSAAGEVGEQADTLRRADGLTIRRLSWSLQLRHVETLANDLPASAWKARREDFYTFAYSHILRPEKLFAHYAYLSRLLGFAVALNEWEQAKTIASRSLSGLTQLQDVSEKDCSALINGTKCNLSKNVWLCVKGSLIWAFLDAIAKNYSIDLLTDENSDKKTLKSADILIKFLCEKLCDLGENDLIGFGVKNVKIRDKVPLVALADLAQKPYKKILATVNIEKLLRSLNCGHNKRIMKAFEDINLLKIKDLKEFLAATRSQRLSGNSQTSLADVDNYFPYLFPTRPYTPSEIAALDPRCVGLGNLGSPNPEELWAKYVRVLRGAWVKPLQFNRKKGRKSQKRKDSSILLIGGEQKKSIVVAITNIATKDDFWEGSASKKPNLSLDRYKSIAELINQAIRLKPKPDYLIFPELSLPLEWIDSIAAKLISNGINLIAGTEYKHSGSDEAYSEACMELVDDRLGFPASVRICQPKLEPAVGEDKEFASRFGLKWKDFRINGKYPNKPIYNHNGFYFGVMVCSELQNSKSRLKFQGYVDSLIVLSWNKDLDTFSALVESAALDIHAYTILVNNRLYGDSRVRSPAKESFQRDIARLRGGKNDFCVAVELDIQKLRKFQSRAKRWPDEKDPFKPVPEGFEICSSRKVKPPG